MNERLKELRKELKLTQQEFADRIGSKRNTIAKYETATNTPSTAVVSLICKEFNVNENWLRNGIGEMFKQRSPSDEVGYYVEDLLEYNGDGNPLYDMIIEMMKKYHELDEKSKLVIRNYFGEVMQGIKKEQEED